MGMGKRKGEENGAGKGREKEEGEGKGEEVTSNDEILDEKKTLRSQYGLD